MRQRAKQAAKQLALVTNHWGGKRKGAGRKRLAVRSSVPHRTRAPLARRLPLHVTMRMAPTVYNLRSRRSLRVIKKSLREGADRFGTLVVQTSVQGNHIHMLVEASDARSLARAMRGLAVRLAKGLNAMMGRSGRVIDDRYHSRVLRTPTEVRHAKTYLLNNHRHHVGDRDPLPATFVDPFTSDRELAGVLPAPTLWLLRVGWQRARGSDGSGG